MKLSKILGSGTLALSTVALLGLSGGAAAATSDPTEMRGYNNCIAASDTSALSGVTLPRVYYISKRADVKTYYVNTTGWQNGQRVTKRVTCETNRSGRKVLSVQTSDGRYVRRDGTGLIVAKR